MEQALSIHTRRLPFVEPDRNPILEPLISIDETLAYLHLREKPFLDVLKKHFGQHGILVDGIVVPQGWEDIFQGAEDQVLKMRSRGARAIFTGRDLCDLSAVALSKAIPLISKGIKCEVVAFQTDFSGIDRRDFDNDLPNTGGHVVLRLTQNEKRKICDPTYAQIDHKYTDQFLTINDELAPTFYPDMQDVAVKDEVGIRHILARGELMGFDKYDLNDLVMATTR